QATGIRVSVAALQFVYSSLQRVLHMKKSFLLLLSIAIASISFAQKTKQENKVVSSGTNEDDQLFSKVKYRLIGPFRGGRSAAVAGSYKNKNNFYFGAT